MEIIIRWFADICVAQRPDLSCVNSSLIGIENKKNLQFASNLAAKTPDSTNVCPDSEKTRRLLIVFISHQLNITFALWSPNGERRMCNIQEMAFSIHSPSSWISVSGPWWQTRYWIDLNSVGGQSLLDSGTRSGSNGRGGSHIKGFGLWPLLSLRLGGFSSSPSPVGFFPLSSFDVLEVSHSSASNRARSFVVSWMLSGAQSVLVPTINSEPKSSSNRDAWFEFPASDGLWSGFENPSTGQSAIMAAGKMEISQTKKAMKQYIGRKKKMFQHLKYGFWKGIRTSTIYGSKSLSFWLIDDTWQRG